MQNKENATIQKKSRAKYVCPPELDQIIQLVNLVPFNFNLEHIDGVVHRLELEKGLSNILTNSNARQNNKDEVLNLHKEALMKCLEGLPSNFLEYMHNKTEEVRKQSIFELAYNSDITYVQIGIYSSFYSRWWDVNLFVDRIKRERKGELFVWDTMPFWISAKIQKDENGKEYLSGLAGLIGKFHSDRLRICETCFHAFWAVRRDSETCSKTCLNILRQRNHRNSNRDKINTNRRENYRLRKMGVVK